jgi:pyrroline-5-carboxylate reductase
MGSIVNLGFIGTGALTSAIVTGLKTDPIIPVSIHLSPRNEQTAAALASRYPDVWVATDNQEVLDNCETVMLALRPQVAHQVLPLLKFRRTHHVVALMATMSRDEVASLVLPAERVTKALPIPMVAHRQGATLIYPFDPAIAALFGSLGRVIEVGDPTEFNTLTVATATFATYFKYLDTIHGWLRDHGVSDSKGRDYVAALFQALANAPEKVPGSGFMQLAAAYATPGGINEQMLRAFTTEHLFEVLREGLDSVHRQISGS